MQICLTFVQKGPETRLRRYPFCLICLLMGVIVLIPHNNNNPIATKNMLKKTLFANPKKKKTKIGYKWAIFKVTGLITRELKPNLKLVVPQGFYKRCAFLSFCLIPIYHSSACLVSSRQNKYSIFTIAFSLFRFFLDVIIYLFVSHLFVFQKLYPLFLSVMLTPDGANILGKKSDESVYYSLSVDLNKRGFGNSNICEMEWFGVLCWGE